MESCFCVQGGESGERGQEGPPWFIHCAWRWCERREKQNPHYDQLRQAEGSRVKVTKNLASGTPHLMPDNFPYVSIGIQQISALKP